MRIERVAHSVGVPTFRQIDMRDLRTCMHARIRASGALHQYLISRQRLNCRGQNTLHGDLVSLNLPAGKRRAVIFDDKLVAGHRLACITGRGRAIQ